MRPLVLLHGFTGSPRSFDALATLLPDRPLVRPTLPGHGAHAFPASRARTPHEGWERAMDRVVASLAGLESFDLLGYSLGGRVALGVLARIPDRVASVVLVGAHLGLASDDERAARRAHDARFVALLVAEGVAAFADAWEAQPMFASQRRLSDATAAARAAERRSHTADGLARSLEDMGLGAMPDLRPALASFGGPVTYVVGADDAKFRAHADDVRAVVPRASLVVVEGAGHDVVLEAPHAIAEVLSRPAHSGVRASRDAVPSSSEGDSNP